MSQCAIGKPVKSCLRYSGGKYRIFKNLFPYFRRQPFTKFIEPSCGGAGITLSIASMYRSKSYWLNDTNSDLILFWQHLRSHFTDVHSKVKYLISQHPSGHSLYHYCQSQYDQVSGIQRSVIFYVLNRICYHGSNVRSSLAPSLHAERLGDSIIDHLLTIGALLQNRNFRITNFDLFSMLPSIESGSLVFLDPPYDYTIGYNQDFYGDRHVEKFDHYRLSSVLQQADFNFVLTYNDSSFIRSLYEYADVTELVTANNMVRFFDGKTNKRDQVTELIITNIKKP